MFAAVPVRDPMAFVEQPDFTKRAGRYRSDLVWNTDWQAQVSLPLLPFPAHSCSQLLIAAYGKKLERASKLVPYTGHLQLLILASMGKAGGALFYLGGLHIYSGGW